MQQDPKIIILTAGYGNGHIQVSNTLKQSFHRHGIDNVKIIDLYQEAHPGLNSISRYLYLRSSTFSAYGLDYYGWSYYMTRNMEHGSALAKWFNLLGMKRLVRIMKEEQPDAVVNTFPFGGVSGQLAKVGLDIPQFTVVTDFSLHNRWLLTDSERFYVATDDLKREMVRRGVQPGKVAVSGIPVRESFYARQAERSRRDDPRSILIITGAHGILPDIKQFATSLLAIPGVRIDIICGQNNRLKRELERRFGYESRIRLFGYVESLHERMRQASCVVTKAGGITLSEAIQIGTPILIYKPFPGQERENARYLESKQAASVSVNVKELVTQAKQLFDSEERRRKLSKLYETFVAGPAADTIVQDVLSTVANRPAETSKAAFDYMGAL